jgi:S-adenosylmethionine hydrolase
MRPVAPPGAPIVPCLVVPTDRPVFTLLTDFGTVDPFVGVMKGVIVSRCPGAQLIDLTHGIAPQAVAEASFWLERSLTWFPADTLHIAVVDPGVGTERRALALRAHGQLFFAPDNGLLGGIASSDPARQCRAIDLALVGLPTPSATFHGRDVFAPIAAELAAGRLAFDNLGAVIDDWKPSPVTLPRNEGGLIVGEIVTVDRFGNLISNIDAQALSGLVEPIIEVGAVRRPLSRTYADAAPGDFVAVINAFGTVELARRDGSAADSLELGRATEMRVRKA